MKNLLKNTLTIIALSIFLFSCQEELEIEGTATETMSGDWWVEMGVSDGAGGFDGGSYGFYELSTFNTASNSTNEMWLTDNDSFWWYKVKVNINLNDLTFSVTEGTDLRFDDNTTITNGKITPGGATTPSGEKADAIYFEVEWASDPGTVYIGKGYRYTGWPEDDH